VELRSLHCCLNPKVIGGLDAVGFNDLAVRSGERRRVAAAADDAGVPAVNGCDGLADAPQQGTRSLRNTLARPASTTPTEVDATLQRQGAIGAGHG